jgi:hypothetical protein
MTRIVVLGRGWFGRAAADMLRRGGGQPIVASRRPAVDLFIDAEDPASIRAALHERDVVVDAAGPFQRRSTALVESCMTLGCDVIDLSDSLDYARRLRELAPGIERAGIRVLTSCSSVSAVSAALVRLSGMTQPVRVSAFLAPATGNTSTAATSQSLFSTLERPIRVWRGGAFVQKHAFSEVRRFEFPSPVGSVDGRLAESPDGLLLPPVWPTLRDVDFWIDTRRRALNALFAAAARRRSVLQAARRLQSIGRRVTKYLGAKSGGFGIEVEDRTGTKAAVGFVHATHSYVVAVAPAVLAARAIAAGRFRACGLIPPDRYVDPQDLAAWLERAGVSAFGLDDA